MNRARMVLIVCFCAAMFAGFAVGFALPRHPDRPDRRSWLSDELNLSPEQREQMREIWSEATDAMRSLHRERRRELRRERDEAIAALLSEEQAAEYARIENEYEEKVNALERERRAAFEEAVSRTREILTETQREKYDEMMSKRPSGRRGRNGGRGRAPSRSDSESGGGRTLHPAGEAGESE